MIDTYIMLILLGLSLLGWGFLVFVKIGIPVAFIPIFIFSGITSIMFLAGLLNMMTFLTVLIFIGGLLFFVRYASFFAKGRVNVNKLVAPAAICFIIFSLTIMVLVKGVIYLDYDNFSHWGLIVKEMFMLNSLPDGTTVISYRNYPPGSAVFIYFVNYIIGYTESHTLMAQGLLLSACLTVLFVFSKWKHPLQILLAFAATSTLLFVIERNIYNLLVDTLLGLVALALTVVIYYYRFDWKKLLVVTTPLLITLILVKDSGKIFYLFSVTLMGWFLIKNHRTIKAFSYTFLFSIMTPLFTNFLWLKYTEKAYPNTSYEDNKFAITPYRFLNTDKSAETIQQIGLDFLHASFDMQHPNVQSLVILNIVGLFIFVFVFVLKRQFAARLGLTILWVDLCYGMYLFILYVMYIFLMPENEAVYLASFHRYQATIVIYCIGVFMTVILLEWKEHTRWETSAGIKAALGLGLCFLFIFPFHSHIESIIQKPEMESSLRLEVRQVVNKIKSESNGNPRMLYYSPESANDHGYLRNMLVYEHLSWNFKIFTELDQEQFTKEMKDADYVVILEEDESARKYFAEQYDIRDVEGVYDVVKRPELILQPLE
ncbi:hypothetical protein GWK91_11300 [Virgibacillus sp. MSP4-1]|uniref:hypothetical protein n=1 Tax=Virgibacillus sp. MSP4-1 TaxID=2700081 RepID=UPI0003A92D60|nr:hypothetical protein [Virgibacillus sp. MSP4-1]QHS23508.1 hypothetical protein GWK91_11300 [Virgibacillus sp. MSP4-1]